MKYKNAVQYGLNPELMPRHVAVIMDGNGRWAKKRLLNRVKGHEKGSDTVRAVVSLCREIEIEALTLYAFSTENWSRPESEVQALMNLLKRFLKSERQDLGDKNIRLCVIGQKERLPNHVREELDLTINETENNSAMTLNLALSYGAREEITQAVKSLARQVASGTLNPEDISETLLSDQMYTRHVPDPDLIIRTSGEFRLSNFLLWQAAYSELFVTPTLWPDFTKEELIEILKAFQSRDRRFGKVKCSSNDG